MNFPVFNVSIFESRTQIYGLFESYKKVMRFFANINLSLITMHKYSKNDVDLFIIVMPQE